jgi:hypothetical protein
MRLPKYIEIETSRFCNRQCDWCPNHVLKDRTVEELMPWPIYESVITSLSSRDYCGWLAFHNYNEPLANPRLVEEVTFARQHIKGARLTVYTNGDYLNSKLLDALTSAGLSEMRITLYPRTTNHSAATHETLWEWLRRRNILAAKEWREIIVRQGPALELTGSPSMLLINPDVDRYYDRGGILPTLSIAQRTKPCFMTSHSISIDYAGNIKMCCNVVARHSSHRPYLIDNVMDSDVIEIWNSQQFESLRQCHMKSDWSTTPICRGCRQEIGAQ